MGRRGIAKPSARAQIHGIQFEFVPVENPLTQPLGRAVLRAITLLHSAVSEWFTGKFKLKTQIYNNINDVT